MLKDLRQAGRLLLQAKGWTVVVVLSLALGIGANTVLFSAVNGMLLRTIPVREPGTLVRIRYAGPNDMRTSSSGYGFSGKDPAGLDIQSTFSYPMYQQFVAENRTMADLLACAPFGRVNVNVDGQADIANAFISSGNYYQMLGVTTIAGRTLGPGDDAPAAAPAAVISHRYWKTRFASDAKTVGKTVRINNVPVTIVGVLSPEFTGIQLALADPPDVGLPLSLDAQLSPSSGTDPPRISQATYWWLQVMGRLKPGVTATQVQTNLGTIFQQTARAGFDQYMSSLAQEDRSKSGYANRTRIPYLRVDSGAHGIYDVSTNDRRSYAILSVVVVLVLLIVCANVANLLLSRATTRQKEISIKLSMGATRGRLVRQMLTESLLLAAIGGSLGILVSYWGRGLLPTGPNQLPPLDGRVLAFMLGVTALTGLVFGIAPALRATGVNVSTALKEQGRSVIGSRRLLSKALLIVQVAISLVLLVGAGLFLRTLANLRDVDVGFNPRNVALFVVNPALNRYEPVRQTALYGELIERLRGIPGVRAVALSNPALLSGGVNSTSIFIQGRTYVRGERNANNDINRLVVSPGFFAAMEIPMRAGRDFTDRDVEGAPRVVIINDAAVRKYFANANPIGQRFGSSIEDSGRLEIVGVLRDAKYNSLRDPAPPTMYVPYMQSRGGSASFEVRTAGDPAAVIAAIRDVVKRVDPNLPVLNVSTQAEQIDRRLQQERLFAQAYTLFGAVALLLASIGLFGLMSYSVSRRTGEIGIRMALGAQRGDVLGLVMRESLWLVVIGVAVGLAIALAAGRLVQTLLFGLAPTDALSLATAVGVMGLVSALAGYLPARRASRVDPLTALRLE